MLDVLPKPNSHARGVSGLDGLLTSKSILRQHFQHFLLFCKVEDFSPKTIQNYKEAVGPFINYCCNELGIEDTSQITSFHVRSYLLSIKDRLKPYSFYDYFKGIRRFFNWLVAEGILSTSPMANMKTPRLPKVLINPFTPEDVRTLLALCNDKTFLGLRNRAIILTFLDTALRLSELANIQIEDVDFNRGIIKVMGKGAKERIVAIQQRTQKALLRYLMSRNDKHPCLWVTEERRALQVRGIEMIIRRLKDLAGLKNVRCSAHTFRHTAATMCLENGAGEFEVQSLLGHSTLVMTRRYTQAINSEKAAANHKRFSPVEHLKL